MAPMVLLTLGLALMVTLVTLAVRSPTPSAVPPASPPAAIMPCSTPARGPLAAYGHSYIAQPGSYVETTADALGVGLARHGAGGAKVRQVIEIAVEQPPRSDLVVIDATINDVAITSPERFRIELDQLVELVAGDATVVVMVAPVPTKASLGKPYGATREILAPYDAAIRSIANARGAVVADVPAWDINRHLAPDGVHPNTSGNALLAAAVVLAVSQAGRAW